MKKYKYKLYICTFACLYKLKIKKIQQPPATQLPLPRVAFNSCDGGGDN